MSGRGGGGATRRLSRGLPDLRGFAAAQRLVLLNRCQVSGRRGLIVTGQACEAALRTYHARVDEARYERGRPGPREGRKVPTGDG